LVKQKQKITYIFHNPNTEEVFAAHILDIFIKASEPQMREIMSEVIKQQSTSLDEVI